MVLETRTGGVHAATVGTVDVVFLEDARQVARAKLGIPLTVPQVVATAETDDVDVAGVVEGLERLDGAVAAVGAGDDDAGVLVGELLLHLVDKAAVALLVLHQLLASLAVVAVGGVDDGDVVEPVVAAVLGGGSLVPGEVADHVELIGAANVEDVVPVLGEEAASLFPVGDALVGVFGGDLLDVLDVVREVEAGAGLDVDAALGALSEKRSGGEVSDRRRIGRAPARGERGSKTNF